MDLFIPLAISLDVAVSVVGFTIVLVKVLASFVCLKDVFDDFFPSLTSFLAFCKAFMVFLVIVDFIPFCKASISMAVLALFNATDSVWKLLQVYSIHSINLHMLWAFSLWLET